MSIHVLTCFQGRRDITEIYLKGFERIRKNFDITYTFCASDQEDITHLKERGYECLEYNNHPLSNKWNYALQNALKQKWTHLLIMGSDDLISNKGLQQLIDANVSYVGYKEIYFYDQATKSKGHYKMKLNRLIGCGRLITREAIENTVYVCCTSLRRERNILGVTYPALQEFTTKLQSGLHLLDLQYVNKIDIDYVGLWNNDLSRALDASSELNLTFNGYPPTILSGCEMVDIKGSICVTKWGNLLKDGMRLIDKFDIDLSSEEIEFLV